MTKLCVKPGFQVSVKSQAIGDFAVSVSISVFSIHGWVSNL